MRNVLADHASEIPLQTLPAALDGHLKRLTNAPTFGLAEQLIVELAAFYDAAAKQGTLGEFRACCQQHPLHGLVRQDPFTERAFSKPRGYAGDAVMLDYIYRPGPLSLSDIGKQLHSATTGVSSAKSISWRRDHLGTEIAKIVADAAGARLLSVASGHLRELDVVRELAHQRNFHIDALDQDENSLKEAVCSYPDFNINPINKSITHLFKTKERACYDLIYSAGLFDYLPVKTASALLQKLLDLLKPSGRLVVGNYATDNFGRGYMEGMMDWRLIYREEADLIDLINSTGNTREYRTYRDAPGNVVYLEVSRRWN